MLKIPSLKIIFDHDSVGTTYFHREIYVVGREPGCDLRIIDHSLSREHCRFAISRDGTVTVEDLSSTNGTLVNKQRILKSIIYSGDLITVGRCSLVFQEIPQSEFSCAKPSFWDKVFRTKKSLIFSVPVGEYVLPLIHETTEFDPISYSLAKEQFRDEDVNWKIRNYLRKVPRTKEKESSEAGKPIEITRFSLSRRSLGTITSIFEQTKLTLSAPILKWFQWRVPWKTIELFLIPVILVGLSVFAGRYFLSHQMNREFRIIEQQWEKSLTQYTKYNRMPYAFQDTLSSVNDFWKHVDRQPNLRNFVIFELLDRMIGKEEITWSLDASLKNLARLQSISSRLPSIRNLTILLHTEITPSQNSIFESQHLLFLSEKRKQDDLVRDYEEYRTTVASTLANVVTCAGTAQGTARGNVVAALTIEPNGTTSSVLVSKEQSNQHTALSDCVQTRLAQLHFDPPPQQESISIVYTFTFAGPSRIEF